MQNLDFFKKFSYSYNPPNYVDYYNHIGPDTLENYQKNLIENKELLKKNNWIDIKIEYSYNNFGFRTYDNFNIDKPEKGNIFLGCSITEGIGLPLEYTWSYKINKTLGGCFYNLGQSGTGIETIYRLLKSWAPIIRPNNVYILLNYKCRREFVNKKSHIFDVFGPWDAWKNFHTNKIKKVFYQSHLISEYENEIFQDRNLDAIKHLASYYNLSIYTLPEEKLDEAESVAKLYHSKARDCIHDGIVYQDILADLKNWVKIN